MDATQAIVLGAFLISVLTFVSTQFGSKRTATASYVRELETRIERLEKELVYKDARIHELETENIGLMKRILAT